MLKHVIAPARFFTQVSNDLIRHPRLGSDAVRLLLWVLSLPDTTGLSLSAAAARAGIRNGGFQRAKRELAAAGYVHEWRRQGTGGRWTTAQLVSGVPLDAEEAVAIRDGFVPSAGKPVVGGPAPRPVGGSPTNTGEKTDHPPSQPSRGAEPQPAPESHPLAERGALVLASLSHQDRRLRLTGREVARLAPLAGEWLLRGVSVAEMRETLTAGLPEPVHCAAALLRDRLDRKMPQVPRLPEIGRQPSSSNAWLEPRVGRMRECRGERHIQPRLFTPLNGETLCGDCRQDPAGQQAAAERATRGAAAVRAALRG
ncbi:hypothetical protein [Streptomyces orinoci]|uniref:Helix-turn-helix domain-containing protein n=1 Tax=Streptomyces orinoci TaxID=67339 RepID=A0ABV3JSZ7_STRON|nr:hypothetical protein [Streptomyces orinoci]